MTPELARAMAAGWRADNATMAVARQKNHAAPVERRVDFAADDLPADPMTVTAASPGWKPGRMLSVTALPDDVWRVFTEPHRDCPRR